MVNIITLPGLQAKITQFEGLAAAAIHRMLYLGSSAKFEIPIAQSSTAVATSLWRIYV